MTAKRKIRDAQDARQCLEAAQASGKGRQAWAQKHGIDGRSLYAWEKKLAFNETQPAKRGGLGRVGPRFATGERSLRDSVRPLRHRGRRAL